MKRLVGGLVLLSLLSISLDVTAGETAITDEEVLEALMMADVEVNDVELDEEYVTVYAPQSSYAKVREALVEAFGEIEFDEDDTTWIPQNYVEVDEEGMRKFDRFREMLDEIDDVQELYHNIKNN